LFFTINKFATFRQESLEHNSGNGKYLEPFPMLMQNVKLLVAGGLSLG
jgi:hypothetical protein